METNKNDNLILSIAEMLVGNHTDTKIIQDCLVLFCENFMFDAGFIYEIDQNNIFHLKESHFSTDLDLKKSFSIDELASEYRKKLSKIGIYHVNKSKCRNDMDKYFLDFFNVCSLVVVPITDKSYRICGFLGFVNTLKEINILKDEKKPLTIAMQMLAKYVGIRIYHKKISFAHNSYKSIIDNTGIDIYVNDFYTHDILYVNKSMALPYGGVEKFYGKKCWEVLFPEQNGQCEFCPQKHLIDDEGKPTKIYTWDYQRAFDKSWFRVFSAAFRWVDGRLAHVVSSADITENKKNEELIQYMANYDSLTNLPNRRMLIADCERLIRNAQENEKGYVLFFDIDGFKSINDDFGHDAGDEFLIKLGEFFKNIDMLKNSVYRNGGDEFVAIIGLVNEETVRKLVAKIHRRFKKPWLLKKGEVICNTSVGVACYPSDGVTAEELLLKADQAMYHAKKQGRGNICFRYEMQ